jgi:hypothetical protein
MSHLLFVDIIPLRRYKNKAVFLLYKTDGKLSEEGGGAMPSGVRKDLSGLKFGMLTVIERCEVKLPSYAYTWVCKCECGNSVIRGISDIRKSLKLGRNSNCGCHRSQHNKTHGKSKTPEYHAWIAAIRRCTDPQYASYRNYGGRGIKVCERWRNSFETFLADMHNRPSPLHSLDRMDNDGNYTPTNCKWSTKREQVINRRNLKIGVSGVTGVLSNKYGTYTVRISHNHKRINLGNFQTLDDAIAARKEAELKYWNA